MSVYTAASIVAQAEQTLAQASQPAVRPAVVLPANADAYSFGPSRKSREEHTLNVFKPERDTKGNFVSGKVMQGKIAAAILRMEYGETFTLTVSAGKGSQRTSTDYTARKLFGAKTDNGAAGNVIILAILQNDGTWLQWGTVDKPAIIAQVTAIRFMR